MTAISSFDARTGQPIGQLTRESTRDDVAAACRTAQHAAPLLQSAGRGFRARLLRNMADRLDEERSSLVAVADRETALGETRLHGELGRTCFQLRLFADVLGDGAYLEATVDHAVDTAMGPLPDLRRMLVPLGPVAVFGASNFPFAFSVPGGDTASALAAGCPVVIKAHPSHPATSELTFTVLRDAVQVSGAPEGTISLVHGEAAGAALVGAPQIRAVGFTGSRTGGRTLFDLACQRQDPIPFYGELSSLNPVVITEQAARARGQTIADGMVDSFSLGAGQFCTKPGLVFLPGSTAGQAVATRMASRTEQLAPMVLLNGGIRDAYLTRSGALAATSGTAVAAQGSNSPTSEVTVRPMLLTVAVADLREELVDECFGPTTIIAFYTDEHELVSSLRELPGSLTATVHTEPTDSVETVVEVLGNQVGRIVWNGYPTGVAVSWSMQHGGPWPSTTNPLHTSVGATAIRRFLRPVCWQDAPTHLLPTELRDTDGTVPRRVDGHLVLPAPD